MKMVSRTVEAMTLPFTISLVTTDEHTNTVVSLVEQTVQSVLARLLEIEEKFSAFKKRSLVCRYQSGESSPLLDSEFQEVLTRVMMAQKETGGAFDPYYNGVYDPTGLVKGWAIEKVFEQYLKPLLAWPVIEAVCLNGGGDMQFETKSNSHFSWKVGIENPMNVQEIVASFQIQTGAIATSGYSKRGQHICSSSTIQQVTIIDTNLTQADIWATAGLVLAEREFLQAIRKYKLSGLYVTAAQKQFFKQGECIDVQEK